MSSYFQFLLAMDSTVDLADASKALELSRIRFQLMCVALPTHRHLMVAPICHAR